MEAIGQDPDLGRVVSDRIGPARRLGNKIARASEDSALHAAARAALKREQAPTLASRARRLLNDAEGALRLAKYDYAEVCAQWVAEEVGGDQVERAEVEIDEIRRDVQRYQAAIVALEMRAGVRRDGFGNRL